MPLFRGAHTATPVAVRSLDCPFICTADGWNGSRKLHSGLFLVARVVLGPVSCSRVAKVVFLSKCLGTPSRFQALKARMVGVHLQLNISLTNGNAKLRSQEDE